MGLVKRSRLVITMVITCTHLFSSESVTVNDGVEIKRNLCEKQVVLIYNQQPCPFCAVANSVGPFS